MNIKLFKAFIASPGDTKEERIIAEKIVSEINQSIGEHLNFRLELLKWENNTHPDFGEDGQDVINKQIGDYDIFIGVMWKRFGTPTNRAESGTEEEFNVAYEKWQKCGNVKIMFYFNSGPIPQEGFDLGQYAKVLEFRKKVGDYGCYYWNYDNTLSFEKDLRKHLNKVVLELASLKEIEAKPESAELDTVLIPQISSSFVEYLNDLEVTFAHSKVDRITLEDIYIPPDLRDLDSSKKRNTYIIKNLSEIIDSIDIDGTKYALIGNESAGKTATCKHLFISYFNQGLLPVYINGSEIHNNIRSEAIRKLIENKIAEQYEVAFELNDFPLDRFVIIIDDFHKSSKGKSKYWPILIKNIESVFKHVILSGSSMMPLENTTKRDAFKNFKLYSILEFGPRFRYELVNKWNTLGQEERFIDKNELLRKNDAAIAHIKTIIGKNYIPPYPFYLLSILQAMEVGNVQNPNYSIHGFYYEHIINECFVKAVKDKKEISLYYNYLTFLSFYFFERQVQEVSIEEFKQFHKSYCEKYDLSYSAETILKTFDAAKLLYVNGRVHIKEKYVYYFFVAKYMANNITKTEVKELITKMSIRIFRDEYASIMMFVTHLSKDEFIIDELVRNANTIFPDVEIAKLHNEIKGINELVKKLPEQVLELVDVRDKREEELKNEEETERLEKEFEIDTLNYDDFSLDDDVSKIDFYARITLALKTIDMLGQVAKKHWGEIDGDRKLNLVLSTYNLGLRTLNLYLQLLQKNSKEIVEHIEELIEKKHFKDRFSLEQVIEETASEFVFKLCFMSSFGITKRISNAIGYDKLKNTFEKVLSQQPYNSVKLIDLAIKLGYAGIPTDEVASHKKDMDKNNLCFMVLQNLVIDHLYMFDTDHKTKSKICASLDINIQEQLRIDAVSTVKKIG